MSEKIKAWLIGITAVSLFLSFAELITENAKSYKYIKVLTSLMLLLTVISPLCGGSIDLDIGKIKGVSFDVSTVQADSWYKTELENELSRRIEDKANELDLECKAEVYLEEKSDSLVPSRSRIYAEYDERLENWIYDNLGVSDIEWKIS